MLTQRSGRENTSSLLDVPKSCRCDPGHGQVPMITDNQSYHRLIFSKAAVTAGAKLKPSKFSDQNFMLTFLFLQISHCATFRRRPLVSTSSAPDLLPWFLFLAEGMRVGRLAAQSDEVEKYRSANGGEALSDDDDEVNNWKDRVIFAVLHSHMMMIDLFGISLLIIETHCCSCDREGRLQRRSTWRQLHHYHCHCIYTGVYKCAMAFSLRAILKIY